MRLRRTLKLCQRAKQRKRKTMKPRKNRRQPAASLRRGGKGSKNPPSAEALAATKARREADLDALVEHSPPAFDSLFIEEPKLVFGGNLTSVDPKTGIDQYGPFLSAKLDVRIGLIGTGGGIDA